MKRGALVDEIRRLERLLLDPTEADTGATAVGDRISAQIARLEGAALKLERRLVDLEGDGYANEAEAVVFAEERDELSAKLQRLRTKIARLEASRPLESEMTGFARPAGVCTELRRRLHELVTRLHQDPTVAKADIRPFQQRLAELVRERRYRLTEAAGRLKDARDYLATSAVSIRKLAQVSGELDDDGPPTLPMHDERAAIVTRVEMAHVAVRDAHRSLIELAHDWPELAPTAKRPDWAKLPFASLKRSLLPPEERRGESMPDPLDRLRAGLDEAYQAARATSLWIDELRIQVRDSPRPA